MTKNNNPYYIKNEIKKPPVETVYELKKDEYQIPTFEEFIKSYESDGKVNYGDLESGSLGEIKGYGPCSGCSGSNRNLTFKLRIKLKNCMGGEKNMTVYNIDDARSEANKIVAETGHWDDEFWITGCFSREDRGKLANRIRSEVSWHEKGHNVDEEVCNKDPISQKEIDDFFDSLDMMPILFRNILTPILAVVLLTILNS